MNKRAPAGLIAVMSALVACADPMTSVRVLEPGDVSLTVTHELFAFPVAGVARQRRRGRHPSLQEGSSR